MGDGEEGIGIQKRIKRTPNPLPIPGQGQRPHLESGGASGALFTSLSSRALSGETWSERQERSGGRLPSLLPYARPGLPAGTLTAGPGAP